MKKLNRLTLAWILIFLFANLSKETHSQSFTFRTFNIEEGICDRFVYTVNQDRFGYLWLGTGAGLCRYDGSAFRSDMISDSIPGSFIRKSYRNNRGELWFGHDDGTISYFDGVNYQILHTNESITSRINDIKEDNHGNLVFASQNSGLLLIDTENTSRVQRIDVGPLLVYSIGFTEDNKILLGTQDSLCLFSYMGDRQPLSFISKIDSLPETKFQDILKNQDGRFLIGTSDRGALIMSQDDPGTGRYTVVRNIGEPFGLGNTNIQDIFEDDNGNLWLSTYGQGLVKVDHDPGSGGYHNPVRYTKDNGLGYNDITEVFQDLEGNIWICTYGNGLALLVNEAIVFFNYSMEEPGESINALFADQNEYWLGGENGILLTDKRSGESLGFYSSSRELSGGNVTSLYKDSENRVWIGTREHGLFRFDPGSKGFLQVYRSKNSLENRINYITGKGNYIWIATSNGVIIYDKETGELQQFSTRDGLPHNRINHIFIDSQDRGWISTVSNRLYYILDGKLSLGEEILYYAKKNEFTAVVEDNQGELWAATYGNGIYHFAPDSIYNYGEWDGLINNYCYSLLADMNNNIWVGHKLGFSRFSISENMILSKGREVGITSDCNPNALYMEEDGTILFGTTHGLIKYQPEKDEGSLIPPINNIVSLRFSDREIDISDEIILPYDRYKLRIEFIGLSYRNPELVTYQYKLENYDQDWSAISSLPQANYGRVEDGDYTFLLRSFNRDWLTTEEPLAIHFIIRKPYWKTWWFITIVVTVLIGSVIMIIKVRERNHRKLQAFLKKSLDERTKEVVEQKEEIETKNREITDSINYAQRIQASILPPLQKLRKNFPGFFVFYQPRDIVSGDFYWFDEVGEDRFVIVCADSTGHGVPGAFMSMIGSTLIKDIVNRSDVKKPSHILATLDQEITDTLNQNIETEEQSNDGMDIIVCEINVKTRHVSFASAMRPIIIYHNGEQMYIRGNRSSVGGEIVEYKSFVDQEFQLLEGDIVYMFSDGYPDQFGGPMGKKYKMLRLKNLLEDIHQKSMDEQYEYVKNNFDLWRGNYEQVDDILFMAIKV